MKNVWKMLCFVSVIMSIAGCGQQDTISEKTEEDSVKDWLQETEENYNVTCVEQTGANSYAMLTTYIPPGVKDDYTMVRVYIVEEEKDGYSIKSISDANPARSAGFSAKMIKTEDTTILFGDIGGSVLDLTSEESKEVTFTEIIVALSDGAELVTTIQNNTPYMIFIPQGLEVMDILYKTESGEIRYSDFYEDMIKPEQTQ